MTFWSWALAAYARDGVEQACLDLQDDCRQPVPYLLWAAWAAGQGRELSAEVLQAGALLVGRWEQAAVSPLRQARRGMKAALAGLDDGEHEALRGEVKALELRAEQAVMAALERMAPEPGGPALPLEPALAAAAAAWPFPAPEAALGRLARALG